MQILNVSSVYFNMCYGIVEIELLLFATFTWHAWFLAWYIPKKISLCCHNRIL